MLIFTSSGFVIPSYGFEMRRADSSHAPGLDSGSDPCNPTALILFYGCQSSNASPVDQTHLISAACHSFPSRKKSFLIQPAPMACQPTRLNFEVF